jgi:phospholipid/cholesterol/gamma-HCH transport system substrate-binding protein
MRGNVIETVMGAVVLVVAAAFLFFAYTATHVGAVSGYDLTAQFDRIDGIHAGSDVRISGVKVGSVVSTTIDPKTFFVTVDLSIDPKYRMPDDTVAEVLSNGLLGDKYMALVPGGSDKTLPPGGRIKFTQAPVSLENLIGQMIFSQPGQGKTPPQQPASPQAPAAPK